MNFDKLAAKIRNDIATHGRSVLGIFANPENGEPAFCYTIGNDLDGLPELLLIGGYSGGFAATLNALSDLAKKNGHAFKDGERVLLDGAKCPVLIVDARDEVRERFTIQVGNFLEHEDYAVQQVVSPDTNGRFPGEANCAEPYASIPVFRRINA